jgi:hypothetical protein
MNEHAVLAECERGEDTAKHAYEAALKQDLPMDVRTIIERQYQGVKENHDRVRNLRNGARRARLELETRNRSALFGQDRNRRSIGEVLVNGGNQRPSSWDRWGPSLPASGLLELRYIRSD